MRVAYVDMIGGAAGDMLMAAWIDAGADAGALERALRSVVAEGWELTTERVVRAGICATHVDLIIPGEDERAHEHGHEHEHGHTHDGGAARGRRLRDILEIVERSGLTPRQIERASAIYGRLAEAESRVHGTRVDDVSFHEVGQVDAILDVAGTCVALDLLGIDELRCSAFPYGYGLARMHHGVYPNPSPATIELLRGLPLRALDVEAELVTTTGAAILSTLVVAPGVRPDLTLERIGYGAGRKAFAVPNVVRVMIGTAAAANPSALDDDDDVVVVEANIDDMLPQHYELALERLFAAGALDVWLTPVVMKKGRLATLVAALAPRACEAAVARTMLRETTTLGVRVRTERRYVLAREIVLVETPYGPVRVKRVELDDMVRSRPEYDDLVRIARERELPLAEVVRIVDAALAERTPA